MVGPIFIEKSPDICQSTPPFFEVIHNHNQFLLSQKKSEQIPEIWSRREGGSGMQFKRVLQKNINIFIHGFVFLEWLLRNQSGFWEQLLD